MRSWVRSSTSSLIRYCVYLYYSTWYIHLYTDCTRVYRLYVYTDCRRVYRLYACIQTHMLYTSFIYMYSIRIVSIVHRSMHVLIAIGFRMLHVHVDGKVSVVQYSSYTVRPLIQYNHVCLSCTCLYHITHTCTLLNALDRNTHTKCDDISQVLYQWQQVRGGNRRRQGDCTAGSLRRESSGALQQC